MTKSTKFIWATLWVLCFLLSHTDAALADQGTFEVRIKDHRDAIGDFAKLIIAIDKISISAKPGLMFWQAERKDLAASPDSVDLTQYVGAKTVRVARASVNAGAFDEVHLKIKTVNGVLKKSQRAAPIKNTIGPLQLSFQVPARGETLLVLDLTVMDLSDHPPRGYELSIKGYELYTNGKLLDKVPPG